jgi:hypothetical protein
VWELGRDWPRVLRLYRCGAPNGDQTPLSHIARALAHRKELASARLMVWSEKSERSESSRMMVSDRAVVSGHGEPPGHGLGSFCCDAPDSWCVLLSSDTGRVACDTDRVKLGFEAGSVNGREEGEVLGTNLVRRNFGRRTER